MISGDSTESVVDHLRGSLAASAIFFTVFSLQFLSQWLDFSTNKKNKMKSSDATETRLREEIKQLLKEASALSQPSTFAQAAKLRRSAAAKEKELANHQQSLQKDASVITYDLHRRAVSISKFVLYFVLICWFWKVPVATVSQQLVQPFGKILSWKGGGVSNGNVMVGVIPWLVLCTRVSKFACRLFKI